MDEPETEEDLKGFNGRCNSSKSKWTVLVGEDKARPLIDAVSSGDDIRLRSLLSHPQWSETMLLESCLIYSETRPLNGPDDAREVSASHFSNLLRAVVIAATQGHSVVVATLLEFAIAHNIEQSEVITTWAILGAIRNHHADVFRAIAKTHPEIIRFPTGHSGLPLYEALRQRSYPVAATLLELGADPLRPLKPHHQLHSYHSSVLSLAALFNGPRMTQLLLDHNMPIAGSAALHTAAACSRFDTARVLMDHGADVNEKISGSWQNWTPLHFAAWRKNVEAMEFLRGCGANPDAVDDEGKTPAQVFEESKR